MFAGIVEEIAQVTSLERSAAITAITISCSLDLTDTKIGDSIAVNGVCLTVVEIIGSELRFELASETLRCTTLGLLKSGSLVNIERSLKVGDRIHGHFVFGHIDTCIKLLVREHEGDTYKLTWSLPENFNRYVVTKGSVTLNGVSLTVGAVLSDSFNVFLIPHTVKATNLGTVVVGEEVNLEIDMLARYVLKTDSTTMKLP